MDAEVLRIHETAQPATKPLYDLATDPDQPQRPNWIIRVCQSAMHVSTNSTSDVPVVDAVACLQISRWSAALFASTYVKS